MVVWFVVLLIISFCGDRIILAFLDAKQITDNPLLSRTVDNYSFRLKMKKVNVYYSEKYGPNIYFLDSLFGRASLVIGKEVQDILSEVEMATMIFAALLRIERGDAKFRTITSMIFSLFDWIFLYGKRMNGRRFFWLRYVLAFYFLPLMFLRIFLFERKKDTISFDRCVINSIGNNEEFSSAFFKLSQIELPVEERVIDVILDGLSIVSYKKDDIFFSFFKIKQLPEERYNAAKL